MLCRLEENILEGAAQDRLKGLSFEQSIVETKNRLKGLDGLDRGLIERLEKLMQTKVADIYYTLVYMGENNNLKS